MSHLFSSPLGARALLTNATAIAALVGVAACSAAKPTTTPKPNPANDPRVGLKAGLFDAGEAVSNMKVTGKAVSPPGFLGVTNSDLAFTGNYAIQGNYNGPVIWDVSNPNKPTLVTAFSCPASQNDISVYRNLMFMSAEAQNGRTDCMPGGAPGAVNKDRMRGVRIFDITDIKNPKLIANVQTCRGSHTHTVLEDPKDKNNVYLYVSGLRVFGRRKSWPGARAMSPAMTPTRRACASKSSRCRLPIRRRRPSLVAPTSSPASRKIRVTDRPMPTVKRRPSRSRRRARPVRLFIAIHSRALTPSHSRPSCVRCWTA